VSLGSARLNVRGKWLLVERVLGDRRPVSHVAAELGISRQCAHQWVNRYLAEGVEGLQDRSSRAQHSPNQTAPEVQAKVLELRPNFEPGRRGSGWSWESQLEPLVRSCNSMASRSSRSATRSPAS
jgi:transposase